eukprot:scaffold26742_cov60-Phaeocystis_antarctica.AAC.4
MSYSLIMRLIVQQVRARGVRVRTWRVKLIHCAAPTQRTPICNACRPLQGQEALAAAEVELKAALEAGPALVQSCSGVLKAEIVRSTFGVETVSLRVLRVYVKYSRFDGSSQCTIVLPEECLGYGLVVPFLAYRFALWFRIMKT